MAKSSAALFLLMSAKSSLLFGLMLASLGSTCDAEINRSSSLSEEAITVIWALDFALASEVIMPLLSYGL